MSNVGLKRLESGKHRLKIFTGIHAALYGKCDRAFVPSTLHSYKQTCRNVVRHCPQCCIFTGPLLSCGGLPCRVGIVRSQEADYISSTQCAAAAAAVDLTAPSCDPVSVVVVRPVAVKLPPLRVVSDRMNVVDAGAVEPPARRPAGKPAGARDVTMTRLTLGSLGENVTGGSGGETWSAVYDGGEAASNSDDEVCDVFSRARRLQAVSDWLSCDVAADGRCRVRGLLRALQAAGGAVHARSTAAVRPCGPAARRWLHDSRSSSAVMNAVVELPRPLLDFAKMQVFIQSACRMRGLAVRVS